MRESASPLVTVVIGVYNAGEYLRPAVQSVLAQTYQNIEILIVDDGSTDGCIQSIQDLADPRIRVLRQENRGRPATLNRALDEATGDFYVIQDADDLSYPTRIERLVDAMLANGDIAAAFSGHDIILGNRRIAPRFSAMSPDDCGRSIDRFSMPAHDPTGMFRMSMVRGFRYDTTLPFTEAVDYILRIGERHPLLVVGECLYTYRIHESSITHRDPMTRQEYVRECLRRACTRRGVDFNTRFAPVVQKRRSRNEINDNNLAAHFIESSLDHRRAGLRWGAVRTGLQCVMLHPLDWHYHKALIYAVAPMWMVRRVRSGRAR